jgi:hypothetical protein
VKCREYVQKRSSVPMRLAFVTLPLRGGLNDDHVVSINGQTLESEPPLTNTALATVSPAMRFAIALCTKTIVDSWRESHSRKIVKHDLAIALCTKTIVDSWRESHSRKIVKHDVGLHNSFCVRSRQHLLLLLLSLFDVLRARGSGVGNPINLKK